MKDYKLECEKLKAEIKSVNRHLDWMREELARRNDRDAEYKQRFRQLLMDTLRD